MAIVRLEFDLDSDVYPELHQALSALRSPASRSERLRQLATLGLVWENVRIYGAEAIGPSVGVTVAVPPPAPSPVAAPAPRASRSGKGKAKASAVLAELPITEPRPPLPADFVDLAIDAKRHPGGRARNVDEVQAPLTKSELEEVASELPVLLDIVADTALDAEPPALHRLPPADEREGEPQEEAIHLTALADKPAMRSRLMRMKERGLFKNG